MFPNNEFWQCPSYTWSSFVLGIAIWLILAIVATISEEMVPSTSLILVAASLFWIIRTFVHFVSPNEACEAKGYPGQHYMNPFAASVIE
jgi:hypothetical protein